MKKLFAFLLAALIVPVFAGIPASIVMESGKVRVRLDEKKRWNINKIEWNDRLFGIDLGGAHYGIAYQPQGSKFYIGSGHAESGIGEEVVSIKFFVDDKEVPAAKKITGKKISVEKVSRITAFQVKYSFTIEQDILSERTEISAAEPVKVNFMYVFMHPWSTRFNLWHGLKKDGAFLDLTFHSDESFPNREFLPVAAWYDTKSGLGVATAIKCEQGGKDTQRFIWDRGVYRKDYICDFAHSTFPAGHTAVYSAKTAFFQEMNAEKWKADAEKLFAELKP